VGNSTKKSQPCGTHGKGFFFVDKKFKISNPDLIRDIENIIKMLEDISIIKLGYFK